MSNFNNLKAIQYKKIEYFCSKVKIENIHTAERYLNEAMWDEKLAVQKYFMKHNNIDIDMINFTKNKMKEIQNNENINFQKPAPIVKNDINFENVEIINENDENYIPLKITNIIDEHKYNNSPTCESLNYIKNNLKTVKLEFNYFLELTKNRIGIILIYKEDIFNMILKDKIKEIKRHVLYTELNENYVIFPVLNNSPIGKELSRQFLCISYPSCLFCEYKKKEQLCVTKRMDGAFDVPFFYNCIPFEAKIKHANTFRNNIPKNENDNNKEIVNKINNFINKKRDYNEDYNYEKPNINNMENNQINDNLKDMNQKNEINNINKNINIGYNKDFEDMKKNENNENIKQNNKENNKYIPQNLYQNNLDNYYMGSNTGYFKLIKKISNEQEDNPNYRKNDNNNLINNSNYNEMNNKNPNQNEMNNPNKNFNKNNNDKYDNNNDNNNLFINKNEKLNNNIINNYNDKFDNNIPFKNKNENLNKNINQNFNDNYNPFINKNENNNYNKYNNNDNPFINKDENSNKNINQNYNKKYENYDPSINKNENLKKIFNNNKKYENYDPFENENIDKKHDIMADSIYGLSDGQILAKREKEIKELERQQLEKEKKEEEEKRKILEEEKRIKKLNNKYEYEAKIVKMFLSIEPKEDNPDACHIKFRHPDGEKIIERRFLKTDKIASLYDYVKSIGREIFTEEDAFDFELIGGFPPKSLEDKKSNTLEEEGMFPNFMLQIKEK